MGRTVSAHLHPPHRRRAALAALAVAPLLGPAGCGVLSSLAEVTRNGQPGPPLEIRGHAVAVAQPPGRFVAGTAVRDLTPPPGFPTGGHGPSGEVARGYWTRLRARAFYLEDAQGHAVALVSADLFAVAGGLRALVARRVAEKLADRRLDVALPPGAVVLAATHTHHGPGNYLTAQIYNQFGSSWPGFSEPLLRFLAERISDAVVEAAAAARARREPVALTVKTGELPPGFLRNRAPRSFELNLGRDALLDALSPPLAAADCVRRPDERDGGWELPECSRLRAVDRALTLLDVTEGADRRRLGTLVFFAAHPTVLEGAAPFYGADFLGHAERALEAQLLPPGAGEDERVTVGFFNGAEGDVTVRRGRRDLLGAADFGRRFAEHVAAVAARGGRDLAPAVAVRSGSWRPGRAADRRCALGGEAWELAEAPRMGAAALGGAEDDRTVLHALGWQDGVRDFGAPDGHGQGPKLAALDSRVVRGLAFSSSFAPPEAFPQAIPLAWVTLGELALAVVPAELTTAQGQAIRGPRPHGALELVGLAGEYTSYCATADEYAAQEYAAASTVWGPQEGGWLACRLRELEGRPPDAPPRRVKDGWYQTGVAPRRPFGREFTANAERPDAGLEDVLRDARGLPQRRLPWVRWREAPGPQFDEAEGRRVTLWRRAAGAWAPLRVPAAGVPGARRRVEDDRGAGLLTMYLGDGAWSALWLRPGLEADVDGTFAFTVRAGGERLCSRPFEVSAGKLPDRVPLAASCPAELTPVP